MKVVFAFLQHPKNKVEIKNLKSINFKAYSRNSVFFLELKTNILFAILGDKASFFTYQHQRKIS
jgi:hypothetical protein